MSISERRSWLVGYDIADRRRLARVHRCLKRHAIPVQYSVFVVRCDMRRLDRILEEIAAYIDPRYDDVRAYHVPDRSEVAVLGSQYLPSGVFLPVDGLARLLNELTGSPVPVSVLECHEAEYDVDADG